MQDRYGGDLSDFLKLGLSRWLVAPSFEVPPNRLGVVWYLTPDESHNADGKHVAYLDPESESFTNCSETDWVESAWLSKRSEQPIDLFSNGQF